MKGFVGILEKQLLEFIDKGDGDPYIPVIEGHSRAGRGPEMKNISIIGAGLVGSLLAIYLARRGYEVSVFESRPDCRIAASDGGRSINLAMSCRGITGLSLAGVMPALAKLMVPMRGRVIHDATGGINYQAFGRHADEYINAVKRDDLNKLLLDEAGKFPSVCWHFDTKLLELDAPERSAHFERRDGSRFSHAYQRLIGADGASSQVRESLQRQGLVSASREFFSHGYKEICIAGAGQGALAREDLHLWPRHSSLLLGNPNPDGSVTGTLFLPLEGENSFSELDHEEGIRTFFSQTFPDVYQAQPSVIDDFINHPTGHMSTLTCSPWHYDDQCLLVGDAAHGLIPFFGQGMNCGFEDCRVLNELLDRHDDDWSKAVPSFYLSRRPNADAVSEMSEANYQEIRHGIRDRHFNLKKQLEQHLMRRYPTRYVSKHVLVMFSNTPYAVALAHGRLQKAFLERICEQAEEIADVDWSRVDALMQEYDDKLGQLAM